MIPFQLQQLCRFLYRTTYHPECALVEVLRQKFRKRRRIHRSNLRGLNNTAAPSSDCTEKRLKGKDHRIVPWRDDENDTFGFPMHRKLPRLLPIRRVWCFVLGRCPFGKPSGGYEASFNDWPNLGQVSFKGRSSEVLESCEGVSQTRGTWR